MIEKYTGGAFENNTYLLSSSGKCIIVDPGLDFEQTALKIKNEYEVVAILLTHGHIDHIDGIRYFDVPVFIHEQELSFLEDDRRTLYRLMDSKLPFSKNQIDIRPIKDGQILHLADFSIRVIHTPGHTIGSVCFLWNHFLFSGDTLFKNSIGRTDFPTGDALKMKNSLKKLAAFLDDTVKIFPGHDEATTWKWERKNNPYLKLK